MPEEKPLDDTTKISVPKKLGPQKSEQEEEIQDLQTSLNEFALTIGKTQGKLDLSRAEVATLQKHAEFVENVSLQDRQKLVDAKKDIAKLRTALALVKDECGVAHTKRKKEIAKRQQSSAQLSLIKKEYEKMLQCSQEPGLDDCLRAVPVLTKDDIEALRKVLTKRVQELNGSKDE